MKKFTNIIGYLAAFAMLLSAVFKFNHLEGAGLVMVITMLFLCIYFPVFILSKMRESAEGKLLPIHIVAALCAFIIILAIAFKFQHWMFSGLLITAGLVGFSLIFLPMLVIQKSKQAGPNNLMNIIGAIGLALFALGILFKMQHWAGGSFLIYLSPVLLFLIYFPMYMMNSAIPDEKKSVYLRNAFFVIIIGCLLTIFIYRSVFVHDVPSFTNTDTTITNTDSTMHVK